MMRFSEAIRLGSMTTKPIVGMETAEGHACARAAALTAIGLYDKHGNAVTNKRVEGFVVGRDGITRRQVVSVIGELPVGWYQLLFLTEADCPARCGFQVGHELEPLRLIQLRPKVWEMLAHLNDAHLWTRTRIADWVETVEDDLADKTEEAGYEKEEDHATV